MQIIVGTGGANEGVYPFGVPIANSMVRNQGTPGVLLKTSRPLIVGTATAPIA